MTKTGPGRSRYFQGVFVCRARPIVPEPDDCEIGTFWYLFGGASLQCPIHGQPLWRFC